MIGGKLHKDLPVGRSFPHDPVFSNTYQLKEMCRSSIESPDDPDAAGAKYCDSHPGQKGRPARRKPAVRMS
ncbi:hypothetical protein [Pseudogemmobacter bohemicus]|uniref:hypothetical protein n=1 Tax=Pseudogemmobacter bohemicus TaxID=2250708 RepID=UPI0013001D79|nr:hypothetical protein [Pseudogemmobacter bohemicus]